MKNLLAFFASMLVCMSVTAQLQLPPSGSNQKSVVTQYMGALASVTIVYNSPDVTGPQGESREGKIWGQLVPYGLSNLNFGLSTAENPSPWRAGANENTVIKLSHDMTIQGQNIKAGKYGLHLIPQEEGPWTLILSYNNSAWGSYFYTPEEDALRVEVTPEVSEYKEWLTFEFIDRQETQCTAALAWENLSIPFTIALPDSKKIYVNQLRADMQNTAGFNWATRDAAANYCLQNDINLEEALQWQMITAGNSFAGNENINTLQTLAGLQLKLEKTEEGLATLEKAANHPSANVFQIHQLGRQLIGMGHPDKALKIFKLNLEKSGDIWPVNVGLARGYSAVGQFDKALKHAKIALERAPDQLNKDSMAQAIEKLQNKQDIN